MKFVAIFGKVAWSTNTTGSPLIGAQIQKAPLPALAREGRFLFPQKMEGELKTVIVTNQPAAIAMGDIDLVDCAMLDWLMFICNSRNPLVKAQRIGDMTWISYVKVMLDMPLLGLKSKAAVSKRLKGLEKKHYLKIKTINQRTYVEMTMKAERLVVDNLGINKAELRQTVNAR